MGSRNTIEDLRGASRLAFEASLGVTDLVQAMHLAIGEGPALLGRPLHWPVRLFSGPIYDSIRGGMKRVGAGLDLSLARLALRSVGPDMPGSKREALRAALNGVLGDHLHESGNPLAIEMSLRQAGQVGPRLLVLVHGSCGSDLQWARAGHEHGAALARDLGFTPVYLHYNSGLHISTNGRTFAGLLEQLVAAWPVPLEDFVILGHSMGGLVAQSACHYGQKAEHSWREKLRKLVCLGTPHHGAPLERSGYWVHRLLELSRYSSPLARLGKIRSAGVTDLRYGNVLDEHWKGRDRFGGNTARDVRKRLALPAGVQCYAAAATLTPKGGRKLRGDGLVPVDSALGRHQKPALRLGFPETNQWIGHGMGHLDLLSRGEVYETLRGWLA